jgi:hypothetical protein
MLLNDSLQFCDRVDFEGHFIEIGDNLEAEFKFKSNDLSEVDLKRKVLPSRSRKLEKLVLREPRRSSRV